MSKAKQKKLEEAEIKERQRLEALEREDALAKEKLEQQELENFKG